MGIQNRASAEADPIYYVLVNQHILKRFRILVPISIMLHIAFTYFDIQIYPHYCRSFFAIRLIDSAFIFGFFLFTFLPWIQKRIIWVMDICALIMSGGVLLMIAVTDGTASHYYEGVNLVILATALINGFYWKHNLGLYAAFTLFYVAAVFHDRTRINYLDFQLGFYFLSSTGLFASLLTYFYAKQHRETFDRNLQLKENQEKLAVLYKRAEELSQIDDLTRIYNRRKFFDILRKKIENCEQTKQVFSLVIFDVDNFKHINDHFGHHAGDRVLKTMSEIVQSLVRKNDFLGRFGGDEFMLILDTADRKVVLERLKTIRNRVREISLDLNGEEFHPSATFGAAQFFPGANMDERRLIELADQELIRLKQVERGGFSLADAA